MVGARWLKKIKGLLTLLRLFLGLLGDLGFDRWCGLSFGGPDDGAFLLLGFVLIFHLAARLSSGPAFLHGITKPGQQAFEEKHHRKAGDQHG